MSGPEPPADPLFMDTAGATTLTAALDATPANAILNSMWRQVDAGLKAALGPRAWATIDGAFDPEKIQPEKTPFVLLWVSAEVAPESEPLQPIEHVHQQMNAYLWVKGKRNNAEAQQELNRVIFAMKKILEGIYLCGGYQVEIMRKGSTIQTWSNDSEGEALYSFVVIYDLPLY